MTSTTANPTLSLDAPVLDEQQALGQQPETSQPAAEPNANAFAVTSFVLGIASIVAGWTFVAPIVGLVFGVLALRRHTAERTLALWGVWLNGVMLALSALLVIAFAVVFGVALMLGLPFMA